MSDCKVHGSVYQAASHVFKAMIQKVAKCIDMHRYALPYTRFFTVNHVQNVQYNYQNVNDVKFMSQKYWSAS